MPVLRPFLTVTRLRSQQFYWISLEPNRRSRERQRYFSSVSVLIFTRSYRSALLVTTAIECIIKPLEVLA